ncbi:AMP-binding protein [Nonomuraea ferruginea]
MDFRRPYPAAEKLRISPVPSPCLPKDRFPLSGNHKSEWSPICLKRRSVAVENIGSTMTRQPHENPDEHHLAAIHLFLGPHHDFPRRSTVLDLFHAQKENAPDRPAIRYRDITVSYADLDAWANVTADRLISGGVRAGQLIPVLIADGPEFPISLFGVMKTGSAFVPLDPAWPVDRLRAIVAELSPPVVVVSPTTAGIIGELEQALPTVIADCAEPPGPADRKPPPA